MPDAPPAPRRTHAASAAAFAPLLAPLVEGAVDYAGLFPPAALAMAPTVRAYAAARRGPDRRLLGRLVLPAARLEEFEAAALDFLPTDGAVELGDAPWRVSVLAGPDLGADLARAAAFNARHAAGTGAGRAVADAVEWKADAPAALAGAAALRARHLPDLPGAALYAELPWGADARPYADVARAAGVGLKLRTGGVTPDAFPPMSTVLGFLAAVAAAGVPAKATAGLHHALPGEHPLTYVPGAARGAMYGFVPVVLAGAVLAAGAAPEAAAALLAERDSAAVAARAAEHLADRPPRRVLDGFGSCSFDEPAAELRALGWFPDSTK